MHTDALKLEKLQLKAYSQERNMYFHSLIANQIFFLSVAFWSNHLFSQNETEFFWSRSELKSHINCHIKNTCSVLPELSLKALFQITKTTLTTWLSARFPSFKTHTNKNPQSNSASCWWDRLKDTSKRLADMSLIPLQLSTSPTSDQQPTRAKRGIRSPWKWKTHELRRRQIHQWDEKRRKTSSIATRMVQAQPANTFNYFPKKDWLSY